MAQISSNDLALRVSADNSVRGLLERRTAEMPDKTFLKWENRDISYGEMDGMANAAANALRGHGLQSGSRVAMMMGNSPEWIALWLGAAKLGAVSITLNTAHRGDGLAYLLGNSKADVLVLDAEFAPRMAAISTEVALPRTFVGAGDQAGALPGALAMAELFTASSARPPAADLRPGAPCSILYTSGTTGPPKGCVLPQGQYLAAAHLHASNCGYGPETTVYTCLPLFHINAQNYSMLSAMAAGGTLAIDGRFSASRFWDRVIATQATAFNFIGAMALALWNRDPSPAEHEHRARVAFGVPIPLSLWGEWEERFNCRVIYAYGMTENALPAIFPLEDTPAAPHLRGSAGKASPTSEVTVVDEFDMPVAPGVTGEILTRPKIPWTMMTEYLERPDSTLEAFRNCWFHTGDLGYLDDDGFLFYVDRKKDVIRRRGEMVSTWELEALITKFPGVSECAVVGVPSEMTEDDILVVIACHADPIDCAELIAYCEQRTAKFQIPRYVRLVAALPRTATQRIEKYRLRQEGITSDTYDAQRPLTASGELQGSRAD